VAPFRCTYRLQLGPALGFEEARGLVPYLRDLGVSHLYLSPSLQARQGSTHGYDVVDPTRISDSLGGEHAFRALCAGAQEAGLGVILDIVPNHMAATVEENPFWRDPLWRAKFFDLDWRTGAHRRFFDVGELAGVRMEDPEVWEITHAKVVELAQDGLIDGLRIDHPDGLANPRRYLERLREARIEHVWIEKILESGERLRDWPVEGTVGYEFLNEVGALFVDPAGEEPLTRFYADFTGDRRSYSSHAAEAKLAEARTTFAAEVEQLAAKLPLEIDLAAALASFDVYRTYVEPDGVLVAPEDFEAVRAAKLPEPLERILLLEERGHDAFVQRFQQTTPPVHAKGVEDTAFYRWNRLVALNEVGGDPTRFSLSVEQFHAANLERSERFPLNLLATTTHDTKRSGDTRARIGVLASVAEEWAEHVSRWHELTGGTEDPNEEYLVYQTLLGTWPIDAPRLEQYLEKALREAKVHTSWIEQDPSWEGAVTSWAVGLLAHEAFLADFVPFAERLAARGREVSLGQVLLKLTCPGVPDIYGGDEVDLFALVDPDNRRPVDWPSLRRALDSAEPAPKLDVIRRVLALRRRRPAAFADSYEPLDAGANTCAFVRGGGVLVAVAVRGELSRLDAPGEWRDIVRSSTLRLAERF
jgi:(1->4)-alpha-D-glucan 1-alpha-D-glucosylmutase